MSDRDWCQISGNLGKFLGSYLALFQGARCQGANMRRCLIQHNGIFITRKGGGEEWVRIIGGGRDLN